MIKRHNLSAEGRIIKYLNYDKEVARVSVVCVLACKPARYKYRIVLGLYYYIS